MPSPNGRARAPLTLTLLLAAPAGASSQIVTDRPDFVESAATVGSGALQVETSVAFEVAGSHPLRSAAWSLPTLLRFGVSADVEVRFESDFWVRDVSSAPLRGESGRADASVGLKWHALDAAGPVPAAALLVHADLPSGSPGLRGEGVRPSLRAVAEWALPRGLGLGVMPGVAWETSPGGRHAAGLLGLVLGKEISPAVRMFCEAAFERLAGEARGGHEAVANAGLAWLVGPSVQLDLAVSLGLTSASPDLGFTVGWSSRFPFS